MLKHLLSPLLLLALGAHAAPNNAAHDELHLLLIQRGVVKTVVDVGQKVGTVGQNVGSQASDLVVNAMGYLGVPYRRGGTGIQGFDCSGFVQAMYENTLGLVLPHNAKAQAQATEKIDKNELRPGECQCCGSVQQMKPCACLVRRCRLQQQLQHQLASSHSSQQKQQLHTQQQSAQQLGVEAKRISDGAIELLQNFAFPGNVRQLENICHWLTVMAPAQMIEAKDLPPDVLLPVSSKLPLNVQSIDVIEAAMPQGGALANPSSGNTLVNLGAHAGWESALEVEALQLLGTDRQDVWDVLTRRFESLLIQAALATTRGRRIEAAVKLGIGRNTITRKIQELHIEG